MVEQAHPVVDREGRRRVPLAVSPAALAAAVLFVLGCLLASVILPGDLYSRVVTNVAQVIAPAVAAATMGLRARRSAGRLRGSWAVLAAGCACWAAGQVWWAQQEIRGAGVPFPSIADAGYLAFPVLAALGLLLYPSDGGVRGRWRRTSDALMTSAAVVLLSWETTLGAIATGTSSTRRLAWALFLAYPVLDVVLIVLCVLTAARTRHPRLPLVLVCGGIVALSVSDSVFAYLQATSSYHGNSADLGWVAGFLLLALAGAARAPARVAHTPVSEATAELRAGLLPYLPVAVALVATLAYALTGGTLGVVAVSLVVVVVALILVRQYTGLRENVRLARELLDREELLRHQAFHDRLTGLANRGLFVDRLEHVLAVHRRDARPVALMFLDLDDFKAVNDTMGHAAGDELLVEVASRLRGVVREGDTVARLGGDEFAILLESGADVHHVAARAVESLREPVLVEGRPVPVRASVGVCVVGPDDRSASADTLLVCSDTAMYAAKRAGKDRVVTYGPLGNVVTQQSVDQQSVDQQAGPRGGAVAAEVPDRRDALIR